MSNRPSRLQTSGEGCGSTLIGCVLVSGALSFVLIVMLSMIPQLRHLVRSGIVRLTGMGAVRVTIPEGWNRFQIASRLENMGVVGTAGEFLEATEDTELLATLDIPSGSAEGYLFPDTYDFYRSTEPRVLVEKFVSNYSIKFRNASRRHDRALRRLGALGDDPEHVAVILASIVQKEAALIEEMPVIAGVFLNRLLLDSFPSRFLQADPTVSYGCVASRPTPGSCLGFDGRLARLQLDDATNPYNTYAHPGLPPGPICNPGVDAIEAVLDHDKTRYLYFVARGDGSHQFSETLDEHKEAVKKYRHGD